MFWASQWLLAWHRVISGSQIQTELGEKLGETYLRWSRGQSYLTRAQQRQLLPNLMKHTHEKHQSHQKRKSLKVSKRQQHLLPQPHHHSETLHDSSFLPTCCLLLLTVNVPRHHSCLMHKACVFGIKPIDIKPIVNILYFYIAVTVNNHPHSLDFHQWGL